MYYKRVWYNNEKMVVAMAMAMAMATPMRTGMEV